MKKKHLDIFPPTHPYHKKYIELIIVDDDTPSGFPMEILECRNLEYLNMYYQGFVSVPAEIGELQELKIINVSHNPNLLSVPAEVGTISCLTSKYFFIYTALQKFLLTHIFTLFFLSICIKKSEVSMVKIIIKFTYYLFF